MDLPPTAPVEGPVDRVAEMTPDCRDNRRDGKINLDPELIDVIEREDLEEENRHIQQCSGMIVDTAVTTLLAQEASAAESSLTPVSETTSVPVDEGSATDVAGCSFDAIDQPGSSRSSCIFYCGSSKSTLKDDDACSSKDIDNAIEFKSDHSGLDDGADRVSEVIAELGSSVNSENSTFSSASSDSKHSLPKPINFLNRNFHRCSCADFNSDEEYNEEVSTCSSGHADDETRSSNEEINHIWRKRKCEQTSALSISQSKKICIDNSSMASSSVEILCPAPVENVEEIIHAPSGLKEWLEIFSNWSNLERIQAINTLISHSTTEQARHMMDAIEPLLRRDFIFLLPKELALMVLGYLPPLDLLRAAQTCRYWRFLADNHLLWKKQCHSIGITSACKHHKPVPHHNKWKSEFLRQLRIENNWKTQPVTNPIVMSGHYNHVITCLEFYGDMILSGSDDNTLKLWSASTGECLRTLEGHTGGVWCCQLRGNLVVSGSTDRTLRVWNAETGECLNVLTGHTTTVRCMHLYKDKVVSGARDATLRMWSITDGSCIRVLTGHRAAVRCVQYNGKVIASGAYDNSVKIWDAETGECLHTLERHNNRVYSLQFDGVHLVSGSWDTSVCVWDMETGQLKHMLHGHEGLITGMELYSNILITGSGDSTAKVWDVNTGHCLYTLSGPNKHTWAVNCLQTTRRFVITSSGDGTVKLWDLRTGEFIRNLVTLGTGEADGTGGVVWRIRASATKLICAVGSRNGIEATKLFIFDFDIPKKCCQSDHHA